MLSNLRDVFEQLNQCLIYLIFFKKKSPQQRFIAVFLRSFLNSSWSLWSKRDAVALQQDDFDMEELVWSNKGGASLAMKN